MMDDFNLIEPIRPFQSREAVDRKPPDIKNENAGPVGAGTGVRKKKAMSAYLRLNASTIDNQIPHIDIDDIFPGIVEEGHA